MVLIATEDMRPGDEVLVSYGREYWQTRLDRLTKEQSNRIKRNYPGEKLVDFSEDVQCMIFTDDSTPKKGMKLQMEGDLLRATPKNRQTRIYQHEVEEKVLTDDETTEKERMNWEEEFQHDNVLECEELAEEVGLILNGRKYEDDETGRLYEIYQVRFDEESKLVIGFRKPLDGRTNREDGSAFSVYGKAGLYELSEQYLEKYPEDRETMVWPRTRAEWAKWQLEDEDCLRTMNKIRSSGGPEVLIANGKFGMTATEDNEIEILYRKISIGGREVIQRVVPVTLQRKTMRLHHEDFSHLGKDSMYETMKLRYYWEGMETDIRAHIG